MGRKNGVIGCSQYSQCSYYRNAARSWNFFSYGECGLGVEKITHFPLPRSVFPDFFFDFWKTIFGQSENALFFVTLALI